MKKVSKNDPFLLLSYLFHYKITPNINFHLVSTHSDIGGQIEGIYFCVKYTFFFIHQNKENYV
jgi:hypothetical protein